MTKPKNVAPKQQIAAILESRLASQCVKHGIKVADLKVIDVKAAPKVKRSGGK